MFGRAIIIFLAAILAFVLLIAAVHYATLPASAHSWYDGACCSDRDCRPIPASEVRELAWDRVLDLISGQELRGAQVRQSKDGEWHICNRGGDRKARPLCVYRPVPAF